MQIIRDFFMPCAQRLDSAFFANQIAAGRALRAMRHSTKLAFKSLKNVSAEEIEETANRIRALTGIERRRFDRTALIPIHIERRKPCNSP